VASTLYLERAENELELAKVIFRLTDDKRIQEEVFHLRQPLTFFSAVIAHSYYSIFYAAKAYSLRKGVRTAPPEEHRKTYEAFRSWVEDGSLDVELLRMYERVMVRADTLLEIFSAERKKRGEYTYQRMPQANRLPAEESLTHARTFFKHIFNVVT